jgi:hypothetical protein
MTPSRSRYYDFIAEQGRPPDTKPTAHGKECDGFVSRRKKSNINRQDGNQSSADMKWYKVDLHLHTPASADYEQPMATYLDWMRKAAEKDLDIVAITDHNTVAGVARVRQEIEWLSRLESEGRLHDEEKQRLEEWRQLANKVLVLPGFEFTATFGFHILGIFPPETSVRQLEHVLLTLNVPAEKLDVGTTETGASIDVITAYEVIRKAGGLPIAAHANSTHGVAMRNFPFGGQTKIAYTQNENLLALEVTDLDNRSRHATARFFNGSKPEYARRMHCIQGSDAHRLVTDAKNPKRLGVGERVTEMLLPEPSFEAIRDLLQSKQYDRIRAYRPKDKIIDYLAVARAEGANLVQSFHESVSKQGGRQAAILADICAFANTDGGVVYVGASLRKGPVKGLANPPQIQQELQEAISERLTPPLEVKFETVQSDAAKVLRVSVGEGDEKPYCLDGSKFYLRNDAETDLAVRDEIVALVLESANRANVAAEKSNGDNRSNGKDRRQRRQNAPQASKNGSLPAAAAVAPATNPVGSEDPFYLPQMGVEVVAAETRNGTRYYAVRDMRNGRTVSNVTRRGARKLWNYAIAQTEDHPVDPNKIEWKGNVALLRVEKRAGRPRYDLVLREGKNVRVFYGVTDDGMEGVWAQFVEESEEA